ncbi:MAG: LMBR1 domain-containing protein [Synergistaceae bacterium]|nr:LMBR1 domain-containing protein [Synergistaceae bacterium]
MSKTSVDFFWDVHRDNPEALYKGRAASRMELDRLIKRIEKLSSEKNELENKLDEINSELYDINQRVDELQRQ